MASNYNDPIFFLSRQQTLNWNLCRINSPSLRSLHPLVDRAIININRALHFFRGLRNQRMTQAQRDHLGTLGDKLFYLAVQFEKEAWSRWYRLKDRALRRMVQDRIMVLEKEMDKLRKAVQIVWRSYHLEVREKEDYGESENEDDGKHGEMNQDEEEEYVWWSDDPGE